MTVYAKESAGIISRLKGLFIGLKEVFNENRSFKILLIISIIFVFFFKVNKRTKFLLLVLLLGSILGIFCGLKFYHYYLLFILFFSGVSF